MTLEHEVCPSCLEPNILIKKFPKPHLYTCTKCNETFYFVEVNNVTRGYWQGYNNGVKDAHVVHKEAQHKNAEPIFEVVAIKPNEPKT